MASFDRWPAPEFRTRVAGLALVMALPLFGCKPADVTPSPPKVVTEHRFAATFTGPKVGCNRSRGPSPGNERVIYVRGG
jgi:hypothetical protein